MWSLKEGEGEGEGEGGGRGGVQPWWCPSRS